jgi:hypothetical protein
MKTLLAILFAFACKPGNLTSYDGEIKYTLKCPDPKQTERPCNFKLELEPGGYVYVSNSKRDTVVFLVTNDNGFYLLKSNSHEFDFNQIDWQK